ncbi:MAG TPA: hypothetical protein VN455_11585 [Methanotrichaceae archaeon]|nr:hypothetical protein [Methanotrichaceae archaeon]
MKRYILMLFCVSGLLASVAVCGIMTADTAKADWLYPSYLDSRDTDDGGSTASSELAPNEKEAYEESDASDENDTSDQIYSRVTNGFSPKIDGFSFENYGRSVQYGSDGLTPAELQRMFGDKVCACKTGGECILTPPARRWMDKNNEPSGHCQGMAMLSTLMYYGKISPTEFGADEVYELSIEDNKPLQHEIAYWAATPATTNKDVDASPKAVLDNLTRSLKEGMNASEWWTLGVYRPDWNGGHAITPFGVEDTGDDQFRIMVYDNNWPGETRYVDVDGEYNTWSYNASTDPDEPTDTYSGNATIHNLVLSPISPSLGKQECYFCDESDEDLINESSSSAKDDQKMHEAEKNTAEKEPAVRYLEISLDGNASLLITDALGRRIGRAEARKFVNEIPGADIEYSLDVGAKSQKRHIEPVYYIPASLNFSIMVDGTWLGGPGQDEEYVTMIGPGYDLVVEGLLLDPGEQDYIDVATVGRENYRLTYRTNYTDSPDLIIGKDAELASYEFMARGAKIGPEGKFSVELDMDQGKFILNPVGNQEEDQFELLMHRIDDYGEQFFGASNITLKSNDTAYLGFLNWTKGQKLYLNIDHSSAGIAAETVEMKDSAEARKYWE